MTRWLLNHLSTLSLAALVVGGTTVLALAASLAVRKAFPSVAEAGFEKITYVLRADVFALLYTVVLALVIADQSGDLAAASSTVSSESSALAELVTVIPAFPIDKRVQMGQAISQYVHAVVEDEWPAMRKGDRSPRAAAALEGLYGVYLNFEPQTSTQEAFYAASVNKLGEITLNRRLRLQKSQEGLSSLLRTLLVAGAIVFIVLAYPASVRRRGAQLVIVGAVAAFVSFAYLLTMVLDYPFASQVSVDNRVFKQGALAVFWAPDEPRPLAPGETEEKLPPRQVAGVWSSDAFGTTIFRRIGGELRGLYRIGAGGIVGTVSNGVFHGWWCEGPTRQAPADAGEVEWRLVKTPAGQLMAGRWRYGAEGSFRGGWDLRRIGGPEPVDLAPGFDDPFRFCRHP